MDTVFDDTSQYMEEFVNSNRSSLESEAARLADMIYAPLKPYKHGKMPRQRAYQRLAACAEQVETQLKAICEKHSIDFWLAFVRQLPRLLPHWEREWIGYATLAILKWSEWRDDTTSGQFVEGSTFGVGFHICDEDIVHCCNIASLSRTLAIINGQRRWIGKGAIPEHSRRNRINLNLPAEVKDAVSHYERRRPENALFADKGVLLPQDLEGLLSQAQESDRDLPKSIPVLTVGKLNVPIVVGSTGESHEIEYFPKPNSPDGILRILKPYEDALDDMFGVTLDTVLHVLHAFSWNVLFTIPEWDVESMGYVFNQDPRDEQFVHRFRFLLNLGRRGFVRLPEEEMKARFTSVRSPFAPTTSRSSACTESFFNAFMLDEARRAQIDVAALEPFPLVFSSPGGNCYFDFLFVNEFLCWLIQQGRHWFTSEHGDRFPLALKREIESRTTARALPQCVKYVSPKGDSAQIDLVVHAADRLYAIECKAFSKPRGFWLGEPKATTDRAHKIKKAVEQAKKGHRILEAMIEDRSSQLPVVNTVEWTVCMPAQEFLKPIDKFGMLDAEVPRVCTPVELIQHLRKFE